ncbi:DHA2 family efflux MFS transporter permease subunit [Streptomyces sp. NPDC059496]|uniref:DHA2 family efflux MFS transporter permease subunit n=1 Tax=Streptomyces sp. NPDC059496 TaxID=3346851 RepID=UPI003685D3EC
MNRAGLLPRRNTAGRQPDQEPLDPPLVRLALVLMLGSFAAGLDTTIVNIAIDSLRSHFHAAVGTVQWVSTAYLLALTMIVPLTAWAADRFGARRMWLTSLTVFLAGSMLCGMAWSTGSLIGFRVLQGLGGGMLLPLVRTILARAAGKERMGRAMVFVAVPGSLTPVLGPMLGGLVINSLDWRWAFYINAPLCLLALALSWRMLPRDHEHTATVRLDGLGLILLPLGLGSLVFGISEIGNNGGDLSGTALIGLAAAAVLLLCYTFHALQAKITPILDLRLFKVRSFTASSMMLFLFGGSFYGALFLLPLYYQQARGASVLHAGLLLAPLGCGMALAMSKVGKLIDRTGAERTITLTGMVLATGGIVPFALVGPHTSAFLLGAATFVTGLGLGAVTLSAFTSTYRGLSPAQIAPATSASRILQQVGGTLGTVFLAVLLQQAIGTAATPDSAFAHTFTWALALTSLAVVPALLLPKRKPQPAT